MVLDQDCVVNSRLHIVDDLQAVKFDVLRGRQSHSKRRLRAAHADMATRGSTRLDPAFYFRPGRRDIRKVLDGQDAVTTGSCGEKSDHVYEADLERLPEVDFGNHKRRFARASRITRREKRIVTLIDEIFRRSAVVHRHHRRRDADRLDPAARPPAQTGRDHVGVGIHECAGPAHNAALGLHFEVRPARQAVVIMLEVVAFRQIRIAHALAEAGMDRRAPRH
ncbi:MAG: hypothetical protein ACRCS9_08770 [Hyphomicrobium sp.]